MFSYHNDVNLNVQPIGLDQLTWPIQPNRLGQVYLNIYAIFKNTVIIE